MKRSNKLNWLLAVLFICGFSQKIFSQGLYDFFNNSELAVTYLGIDFTKAKLINYPNPNTIDIKERIYGSINDVVVNEPKKYDFISAFHKSNITSDLTAVRAANQKINAENIVSNNTADFAKLKESDINAVVKNLDLKGKSGTGILIVMEAMKKADKDGDASMWVVMLDMASKKVLMTDRFESQATGFGFRNYWASTIKVTLDAIEKKRYKQWKEQYGK